MFELDSMKVSRRAFVRNAMSMGFLAMLARNAAANPLGLPLGLQLYSVRAQMAQDLDGALAAVATAGFVEVEAAALPAGKSAAEIRAALNKAGLRCVGAHHGFADLLTRFDQVLAFDAELGANYIICASPGLRPASAASDSRQPMALDDWRYNAETFNTFGERAGMHNLEFGYHNHIHEFDLIGGVSPYEELLRLTDPKKVTFELDCGWARVANHDPVQLMQQYPYRFSMLHVKDFHLGAASNPGQDAHVTELGRGDIDYEPVFAQARKNQRIRHEFVEQEAFDVPWQESLKIDADYIKKLT
jgi:sugar phosphate isomerase/epimerase